MQHQPSGTDHDDPPLLPHLEGGGVWIHRFDYRDHALRVVAAWVGKYDTDRPHSALGHLTPKEYRDKLAA